MEQDKIFERGEGDNWFTRNQEILSKKSADSDWPIKLVIKNKLRIRHVLEIGASTGWRLNLLREINLKGRFLAVEPSKKSIRAGKRLYPHIQFRRGLAHRIPVSGHNRFDIIIVSFVFHWIGRKNLLGAVSEIDRLLKFGGYLIIADFFPHSPTKKPYHHLPKKGVYTYKMNYPDIFLSSGLYETVDLVVFNHRTSKKEREIPADERAACFLLVKKEMYAEKS